MARPFAAFDVDGTIFKSSLAEKVVDRCISDGLFPAEPFNEVYANRRRWQVNNNEGVYQAFLHRLVGTFVGQIAGVEVERFKKVTDDMIAEHQVRKFAFPRRLIQSLRTSHHIIAISGSPDILVEPFLADLNTDKAYGSIFEHEDGRFTGVASSVGDKAVILKRLVNAGTVILPGSVAMGDTVSDIPMLEYATLPIMFNPTATLTNYGKEFGWPRVFEVKDQITALQYSLDTDKYVEVNPDSIIFALQTNS